MHLDNSRIKIFLGFTITVLLPNQMENQEEFKKNIQDD
jgi:hypothetical protein